MESRHIRLGGVLHTESGPLQATIETCCVLSNRQAQLEEPLVQGPRRAQLQLRPLRQQGSRGCVLTGQVLSETHLCLEGLQPAWNSAHDRLAGY